MSNRWCTLLVTIGLALSPLAARAQFLRLGPFAFDANTSVGMIWSDNIDGVRPSEQDKEPEDYYLELGFDLMGTSQFGRDIELKLNSGFEIERHFVRDDLDIEDISALLFRADIVKTFGLLDAAAFYSYEESQELIVDSFVPGEFRRRRNPNTLQEYGVDLKWTRDPLTLGASYDVEMERYKKEEFQDGDRDGTTINYFAEWRFGAAARLRYEVERILDELVNDPEDDADWETTERILFDTGMEWNPWGRFRVGFALGVEREDDEEGEGDWEPLYTVRVSDEYEFTPNLKLSLNAEYTYEKTPEEDDVGFTYKATLDHQWGRNVQQRVEFSREPRATFGSTQDTDTTTYLYNLNITDFFMPNLTLAFAAQREINKPVDEDEETIDTYDVSLEHLREIGPRLGRKFRYEYSLEESTKYDESLIENRVEWIYVYRW